MTEKRITVTFRAASKSDSAIKGHADIVIDTGSSKIELSGLSVIKHDPEKPAWISYPQRPGKKEGKWYDVVKVTGKLHEEISSAVLAAYAEAQVKAESAPRPPKAQIPPRESG